MTSNNKALLYALAAVLFWSTIGSAFKLTLNYLNYTQILLYASFTALVFLGLLISRTGKSQLIQSISASSVAMSALMGFLNPFGYYLILLKAYSLLQAQEAVALNYTWPVVLVLFSALFLKQKITLLNLLFLLISFSGILVIARGGKMSLNSMQDPTGVLLAVGSAFIWALYWLLNIRDQRGTIEKLFLNFCFGFLYTFIYTSLTGNLTFPGFKATIGVVYIGLFEMGITFVLWLNALKSASNTAKVSNLVYLSPFLSLMIVSIAVGEKIRFSTLSGLILIVGGILLQQLVNLKPNQR